jgi:hypothetical protein
VQDLAGIRELDRVGAGFAMAWTAGAGAMAMGPLPWWAGSADVAGPYRHSGAAALPHAATIRARAAVAASVWVLPFMETFLLARAARACLVFELTKL